MSQISIIGSGRSATFLVEYLYEFALNSKRSIKVYDQDLNFIRSALPNIDPAVFQNLDISSADNLNAVIQNSELVISMLPAFLHPVVAQLCIQHHVHFASASYVSDMLNANADLIKSKNLIFLNEMGLDPGIDHMSAMKIVDEIQAKNGTVTGFKSYTGGLVADEDDGDNPWKYKFSWNPRNVVLAAQGAPALYLENGKTKLCSYANIFANAVSIDVDNYGRLDAYPNRDSMKYQTIYGLHNLKDMLRGTLRKSGYCNAWHVFVALGMTDDTLHLDLPADCTMSDWLRMYLPGNGELKSDFALYTQHNPDIIAKFEWLGFFHQTQLPLCQGTSAQIMEEILKQKWVLNPDDKDLVVMYHEVTYEMEGKSFQWHSSLVLEGESGTRTAMAKTVGLPLAVGCKLILENKITGRGVMTPVSKEIYEPVLNELESFGIVFKDRVNPI